MYSLACAAPESSIQLASSSANQTSVSPWNNVSPFGQGLVCDGVHLPSSSLGFCLSLHFLFVLSLKTTQRSETRPFPVFPGQANPAHACGFRRSQEHVSGLFKGSYGHLTPHVLQFVDPFAVRPNGQSPSRAAVLFKQLPLLPTNHLTGDRAFLTESRQKKIRPEVGIFLRSHQTNQIVKILSTGLPG